MRLPLLPKTPFRLALYCLVIYIAFSLVWSLLLNIPTEGTKGLTVLMFAIVGYFYGKSYGILSSKKAFLTSLYFALPIYALRMGVGLLVLSDVPANELGIVIVLMIAMLLLFAGIQLLFSTLALTFASQFGAKKSTK